MKKTVKSSILAFLLLAIFIIGCNETQQVVQTPALQNDVLIQIENDHPCVLLNIPLIVGRTDTVGFVNIYPVGNYAITIDLSNLSNAIIQNMNIMHFKVSGVELTGNLAPGQFPVHIDNPQRQSYTFTFEELGIESLCNLYFYPHFEIGNETGWAGNIGVNVNEPNNGPGKKRFAQWRYYSHLNCCN